MFNLHVDSNMDFVVWLAYVILYGFLITFGKGEGSRRVTSTGLSLPPQLQRNYHTDWVVKRGLSNFTLDCPLVSRKHVIDITWGKNGKEIKGYEDSRVEIDGRERLTVKNVTDEDEGTYSCNATNGFGTTEAFIRVQVAGGVILLKNEADSENSVNVHTPEAISDVSSGRSPEFKLPLNSDEFRPQQSRIEKFRKLACHAIAFPKPKIRWWKNGKEDTEQHDPVYKLKNVEECHSGTYTCEVSNVFGFVSRNFTVHVKGSPRHCTPKEKPTREKLLKVTEVGQGRAEIINITKIACAVPVGRSITLECVAILDNVNSNFAWYKSSEPEKPFHHDLMDNDSATQGNHVSEGVRRGRYSRTITWLRLDIPRVTESDYGHYTCLLDSDITGSHGIANYTFLDVFPRKGSKLPVCPEQHIGNSTLNLINSTENKTTNFTVDAIDGSNYVLGHVIRTGSELPETIHVTGKTTNSKSAIQQSESSRTYDSTIGHYSDGTWIRNTTTSTSVEASIKSQARISRLIFIILGSFVAFVFIFVPLLCWLFIRHRCKRTLHIVSASEIQKSSSFRRAAAADYIVAGNGLYQPVFAHSFQTSSTCSAEKSVTRPCQDVAVDCDLGDPSEYKLTEFGELPEDHLVYECLQPNFHPTHPNSEVSSFVYSFARQRHY